MKILIHWIKYKLKWDLRSFFIWLIILGLSSLSIGYFYSILKDTDVYRAMEEIPFAEELMSGLLGRSSITDIYSIEGFLSLEYFSWMVLVFVIYAVISGSGVITDDIQERTIDTLLSKPFTRSEFFWGKYIVCFITSCLLVFGNIIVLWLGLRIVGEELMGSKLLLSGILVLFATTSFLSSSIFFSSLLSHTRKVLVICLGITVFAYIFNLIVSIVDKASWAVWTPFYHSDVSVILAGESFPMDNLTWLVLMTILPAVAGWIVFLRRDL